MSKIYILFQRAYYTDTTGLPICAARSQKKIIGYVKSNFPDAKRNKKDYPDGVLTWEDDSLQLLFECVTGDDVKFLG